MKASNCSATNKVFGFFGSSPGGDINNFPCTTAADLLITLRKIGLQSLSSSPRGHNPWNTERNAREYQREKRTQRHRLAIFNSFNLVYFSSGSGIAWSRRLSRVCIARTVQIVWPVKYRSYRDHVCTKNNST